MIHLMQSPTPAVAPRFRCGVLFAHAPRGDKVGSQDGLVHINCPGCLRDLIAEMRLSAMNLDDTPETRWLVAGDTGTSSITIWKVMMGIPVYVGRFGVPHDPADFARCHRLLELFPAWRARIPEVAEKHPTWARLVAEWESLTALYLEELPTGTAPRLAERIRELTS